MGEVTSSAAHKRPRKGFVPSGTLSGQVSWELPLEGEGEVEPGGGAGRVERKGWSSPEGCAGGEGVPFWGGGEETSVCAVSYS